LHTQPGQTQFVCSPTRPPAPNPTASRDRLPWNEIEETILQTTPHARIPRAVNAMKVLPEEQEAAE
jgi:hypothetical protein